MLGTMFSPSALRSARVDAGVTQADAARATGSDVRSIRNWETGVYAPSAEVLAVLARLYAVAPGEFFTHESERPTAPEGAAHDDQESPGNTNAPVTVGAGAGNAGGHEGALTKE